MGVHIQLDDESDDGALPSPPFGDPKHKDVETPLPTPRATTLDHDLANKEDTPASTELVNTPATELVNTPAADLVKTPATDLVKCSYKHCLNRSEGTQLMECAAPSCKKKIHVVCFHHYLETSKFSFTIRDDVFSAPRKLLAPK